MTTPSSGGAPKPMPTPRSCEAPRFKGKYLKEFLDEFETLAKAAGISDKERCHYLARYCREDKKHFDHKRFVKNLEEYQEENWPELKKTLELSYPTEEEEFSVTVKALKRFVVKSRNISDLAGFDEYFRNFSVLANLLVKKSKISKDDKNHYFFHGIQPYSLRKQLRDKMERDKTWDDPEVAPEMPKVIEAAQKILKKSRYNIKNFENVTKDVIVSSDDGSDSSDSDDSSASESEEDGIRKISSHRHYVRKEPRAREFKAEAKATSEQPTPAPDAAADEVAQRLDRLTIAFERQLDVLANISSLVKPAASPSAPSQPRVCYMCGKPELHGMKECPETLAFLAAGIIKVNPEGRIIRSDGKPLPRGIPGGGGIAKALKDEVSTKKNTTSNLEMDRDSFLVANYEYAYLNKEDAEYEVMPALRSGRSSDDRTQPYKRPESSQQPKRQLKPEVVITQPKAQAEKPSVPTILKRTPEVPITEDVEMSVAPEKPLTPPPGLVGNVEPQEKPANKSKSEKAKNKVSFEDVELVDTKDKSGTKPKRASPAFKFSSGVQESVDHDDLLDKVLDAPVNITLRELMSTFEMSKRIQAITKTQKIPLESSPESKRAPESKTPRRAAPAHIEEVTDEEGAPRVVHIRAMSVDRDYTDHFVFPKSGIANIEVDSDPDSDESVLIEDEAEDYYYKLREEEYRREYGIDRISKNSVNHAMARAPLYLAMVTAKISVTIGSSRPIDMLLDCGSELNIITQELQETLGLPMDPSGANWVLRGVSGHPVQLVGVCRNIAVDVGGLAFNHHFFVTRDPIGDKGMIAGQPWLFNHAARIDYLGTGFQLQIWENGDREGRSVRISIPIAQSPRNVYRASARKIQPRSYAACSLSLDTSYDTEGPKNPFALRTFESSGSTWELANPSINARQGRAPIIPHIGKSLESAFEIPEVDLTKYGPLGREIDFVNKYSSLNPSIYEALKQTWFANASDAGESIEDRIRAIGLAKGYEDFEADIFARELSREIMGAKYKPVAKKVVPVSARDPEATPPDYKPIVPPDLPPLTTNPRKIEDFLYTEKLTKERVETIIGNVPNGFLTKTELELALSIVFEFEGAFAFTDDERGSFSSKYFPPYVIKTVPHVPWQVKPIRLPKSREAEIMQMLEEQRKAGKYELSSSSYRSTIFAVEKKNGKLRLVHDLQPLNRVTIRDATVPPRMEDVVESLKGRSFYSAADLKAGYDAIILAEESRDLTTFYAYDLGNMRLTTCPQGFTNSMQEFGRCVDWVLKPMKPTKPEEPENAKNWVDDLFSMGPETRYNDETIPENSQIRRFVYEGVINFRRLVSLVLEAGLTISGTKVVIATPALTALGTIVSILGGHVSHEIAAKIEKWPVCRSVSEVRGFLGTVGVVRKWIRDFSKIALPLTLMTRKAYSEAFEWSSDAHEAFEKLKFLASTAPPLIKIDFALASKVKRPGDRTSDVGLVTIAVDSSNIGVGWILSQTTEQGEFPASFGSLTFKEPESRYSQPKLELYGLFRALKAQRHILYGIHFRVKVDARSLIQMVNNPDMMPSVPGNRWLAYIQLFEFEIVHVPAERHKGPDGLSRRRRADEDSSDSESDSDSETEKVQFTRVPKQINELSIDCLTSEADNAPDKTRLNRDEECLALEVRWDKSIPLVESPENPLVLEGSALQPEDDSEETHEHYKAGNDTEESWNKILAYLHLMRLPSDPEEARRIKNRAKSFFLLENILWRRNGTKPPLQVVLEPSRRMRLTKEAHDNSGHRGKDPTYKKLSDSFWWPNMYQFVIEYCRTCHECQTRSSYRNKIPIEPTYVRTILREFGADVVHMPLGKGGLKYIVDMRDKFSGWVEAKALRRVTSSAVAGFIFDVMCRFGCIPKITIDNGSEFKGAVALLAEQYNVPLVPISPYNPSANGVVERGHGVYIESIWRVLQGKTANWPSILPLAIWADRVTAKRTTGNSPYYLLYGQQPIFPFDITDRSWHALDWPSVRDTKDLLAFRVKQLSRRDEFIGEASAKVEKARLKAAEYFYERNKARMTSGVYLPGILVLVWNNALDFQWGNKGALRWAGPYIVVQRRPSGSYVLAELDGTVISKPFAARRLKIYHHRDNKAPIVRIDWKHRSDEETDILESDEDNENAGLEELGINRISRSSVRKVKRVVDSPKLPRPWELRGKQSDEYWQKVLEDWKSGETAKRLMSGEPAPWQKEIDEWNNDDKQYWNYRDDYKGIELENIPRYKNAPMRMPALFVWKELGQWLPPGVVKYACAGITVVDGDPRESSVQLGRSVIEVLPANTPDHEQNSTYNLRNSDSPPPSTPPVSEEHTVNTRTIPTLAEYALRALGLNMAYGEHRRSLRQRVPPSETQDHPRSRPRERSPPRYSTPPYQKYQSYRPKYNQRDLHAPGEFPRADIKTSRDEYSRPSIDHSHPRRRSESLPRTPRYEQVSTHASPRVANAIHPKKETISRDSPSHSSTPGHVLAPFVSITNDHEESLQAISRCLESALATVNRARDATIEDFPKMENSFADIRDSVQKLALQLVDVNKSFRTAGQQLQSRTGALNDAVQSLTTDMDSLRVLMRNIRDEDLATGDYYQVFESLGVRLFHELSKDHNPHGEDMNEFRTKYDNLLTLIVRLDPKAMPSQPAWGSIFDNVLKDLKHERSAEKDARSKDTISAQEITTTLDEILDPPKTSPRVGTSKAGNKKAAKNSRTEKQASSSRARGK